MLWLLLFMIPFASFGSVAPAWRAEALRMTGAGTAAGKTSLIRLRAMPGLDEELRKALKTEDRFLAMDVIGNLRRESLREELIDFSAGDATGFSYLALTAFVEPANAADFKKLFRSRLFSASASAAAKVILLDTLARLNATLSDGEMRALLLHDPSPAVRSAALRFLRFRLLRGVGDDDLSLLHGVLSDRSISPQRRIQALFLLSEIDFKRRRRLNVPTLDCPNDLPEEITQVCRRVKDGG